MNRIDRKIEFMNLLTKYGTSVFKHGGKYNEDVYTFPIERKDELMRAYHAACDTSVPDNETLVDCIVSSSIRSGKFVIIGRSTDYDGFVECDSDREFGSEDGDYLYIYIGTVRYYKDWCDEYPKKITLFDSYADGTRLPLVVCFK